MHNLPGEISTRIRHDPNLHARIESVAHDNREPTAPASTPHTSDRPGKTPGRRTT